MDHRDMEDMMRPTSDLLIPQQRNRWEDYCNQNPQQWPTGLIEFVWDKQPHDDDATAEAIAEWIILTKDKSEMQESMVKRLNGLSPHNNGRVQAEAVDAEATELCGTDSAHGTATVVFMCCGELAELCPECGVDVLRMMTEDAAAGDLIDVEVYR